MKRVFILIITYFLFIPTIYAGNLFSVNSSSKTVAPNSKFSITIKSSGVGRVNIKVDNGKVNEKSVWIEENSKKITVTAGKSGNVTISVTTQEGFSDVEGNQYNPGKKSIVIPIVEKSKTSTTSKKTSTKVITTKEVKIKLDGKDIILDNLKDSDMDANFKREKVSIADSVYDTIIVKDDTALLLDKEGNYYFYDVENKKIINKVLPYKMGKNIYYIETSLSDNEKYSKKQIKVLDKSIDAYPIKDNYYLVNAWNSNGEKNLYIYEEKEETLQLFTEELFTCEKPVLKKDNDNYFKYAIVFSIGLLIGIIIMIIFRRK